MTIYHVTNNSGRINVHQYVDGCYFEKYNLREGLIVKERIYAPRTLDVEAEEQYRLNLLMEADKSKKYILHNHVEPMDSKIKEYLLTAGENSFIYRKDRRAQLGSYAIAMATKQFAKFKSVPETNNIITEVPIVSLTGLLNRIAVWDDMVKTGPVLAYEDIEFKSYAGWPLKQVADYKVRLSPEILEWIDSAVSEYEKTRIG